jgi:hypothetical protein
VKPRPLSQEDDTARTGVMLTKFFAKLLGGWTALARYGTTNALRAPSSRLLDSSPTSGISTPPALLVLTNEDCYLDTTTIHPASLSRRRLGGVGGLAALRTVVGDELAAGKASLP